MASIRGVFTPSAAALGRARNVAVGVPTTAPQSLALQRTSIARPRRQHASSRSPAAPVATTERPSPSNPALSFPCLDKAELRSASLSQRRGSDTTGPEPSYTTGAHQTFRSATPLLLDWGGVLPNFELAYETWGTLNAARSNAILLHTGLSASSHARSSAANPQPGWWERFVGPASSGAAIDTDRYFVVCTNVIGGCHGSTGPSSVDPADGARYATRFPIVTLEDMARAQFRLLDALGVSRLRASVGSSMGGMQALAAATLFPARVGAVACISAAARSHPYSVALRHVQRQVLMADPMWNRGFYYGGVPPHAGMKLARQIGTITYRSGPEWEARFGRRRADDSKPPALCPDFLIETYLDHAGEKWCLQYDANSLLYVSKAMDLFDLGASHRKRIEALRAANEHKLDAGKLAAPDGSLCSLTLPATPYEEVEGSSESDSAKTSSSDPTSPPQDLVDGMKPMAHIPTFVLGVASDILFPAWQQREIAEALRLAGNTQVTHHELGEDKSLFGHDTFLLDLEGVGGPLREWLAAGEKN
jgi:homoserine O-acetyltransferase